MPFDINEINKLAELIPSIINRIVTQHKVNTNVEQVEPVIESYDFSSQKFDLQELELFLKKYNILIIPSGTISERPAHLDGSAIRYNTETNKLEFYNGSTWLEVATDDVNYPELTFSGSNIYFVSKAYGTANGKKGNILAPYNNPWTVASLMQSGDIMWVLDGIYTATNVGGGGDKEVTSTANSQSIVPPSWTSGEYTMYFEKNSGIHDLSTVTHSAVSALFNIAQPIKLNVLGKGYFLKNNQNSASLTSGNGVFLNINHASSELYFEFDNIEVLTMLGRLERAARVTYRGRRVEQNNYVAISVRSTLLNTIINCEIDNFIIPKGNTIEQPTTSAGWGDTFQFASAQGCLFNYKFKQIDIYGARNGLITFDVSPITQNNVINFNVDLFKYTNDSTSSPYVNFEERRTNYGVDSSFNTVSDHYHLFFIRQSSSGIANNEINLNFGTVIGNRLRIGDINFTSAASTNNTINVKVDNMLTTNANGLVLRATKGVNIINIDVNIKATEALVRMIDTTGTSKIYLSGVWETTKDAAIINSSGSGIILKDFVGKGGSTASPITTSGSGNVAVLSAAFNNTTTITGTVVGATPIQNAAF